MEKRVLGKTGMEVSAVTYGGIVSTDDGFEGARPAGNGQEESDRHVEYAIKMGVNYFDVAPTYGNAELMLGNSLIPYRKNVRLACKTTFRTADGARRDLENSLRLLHSDRFDVYQMHALASVEDTEAAFSKGGAMETLIKAKEEGIASFLGITCHSEEAALRALSLYDFDTVLFPLNWGLHLKKGFGERISQAKKEKGFGLLGMKAFIHRSWLSDDERYASRFPKSWCKPISDDADWSLAAMKYSISLGADTLVPPGNFEHFSFAVEHIDAVLRNPLTETDAGLLRARLGSVEGPDFL